MKLSRIDKLRKARSSESVYFMDFMKAVSKHRDILVCFFEGEDEKYFSVRLNMIRPQTKWTGINCSGKVNVLSLKEKILSHDKYKNSFVAFFVDMDFDDDEVEEHPNLYITPCYSVENIYADIESYKNILSAEFGMTEFCSQSNDFEKAVSLFETRFDEFFNVILPFNIWIKAHRKLEKSGLKGIGKLNLKNIKIENLVNITLEKVTPVYDCENIGRLFPDSSLITAENYSEAEGYFEAENIGTLLRGKQQLEFLRVFLTKLRDERSKKENSIFSKRTSIKLQLSKANLLSELSQYAVTPNCLNTFLCNLKSAA